MAYKEELTRSMEMLSSDPRVIFIGQSVKYGGQAMYPTLSRVKDSQKLELPIAEDMEMGMALGLSLEGFIPVALFTRFDFLLLACNQLINHLDKTADMSHNQFKSKVIIRTIIGSKYPLDAGPQHTGDYTDALRLMLKNIDVVKLTRTEDIVPAYKQALESERSTLLVEIADLYQT